MLCYTLVTGQGKGFTQFSALDRHFMLQLAKLIISLLQPIQSYLLCLYTEQQLSIQLLASTYRDPSSESGYERSLPLRLHVEI